MRLKVLVTPILAFSLASLASLASFGQAPTCRLSLIKGGSVASHSRESAERADWIQANLGVQLKEAFSRQSTSGFVGASADSTFFRNFSILKRPDLRTVSGVKTLFPDYEVEICKDGSCKIYNEVPVIGKMSFRMYYRFIEILNAGDLVKLGFPKNVFKNDIFPKYAILTLGTDFLSLAKRSVALTAFEGDANTQQIIHVHSTMFMNLDFFGNVIKGKLESLARERSDQMVEAIDDWLASQENPIP